MEKHREICFVGHIGGALHEDAQSKCGKAAYEVLDFGGRAEGFACCASASGPLGGRVRLAMVLRLSGRMGANDPICMCRM